MPSFLKLILLFLNFKQFTKKLYKNQKPFKRLKNIFKIFYSRHRLTFNLTRSLRCFKKRYIFFISYLKLVSVCSTKQTSPSDVRANEWWLPQAMSVIHFEIRFVLISVGVRTWFVVPFPSSQYPLWPQV